VKEGPEVAFKGRLDAKPRLKSEVLPSFTFPFSGGPGLTGFMVHLSASWEQTL
jgi:hypothetical protein